MGGAHPQAPALPSPDPCPGLPRRTPTPVCPGAWRRCPAEKGPASGGACAAVAWTGFVPGMEHSQRSLWRRINALRVPAGACVRPAPYGSVCRERTRVSGTNHRECQDALLLPTPGQARRSHGRK